MTYVEVDLQQGSSDWLSWRQQGIGASDCPAIWNGRHFETTRESLLWQKAGEPKGRGAKKPANNSAMRLGTRAEPMIRQWYERLTGLSLPPSCGYLKEHPFIRASFDGLSLDHSLVIELKRINRYDHNEALAGRVPQKYLPQIWHQLLVSGCQRVHYVSFFEYETDPDRFVIVPVTREESPLDELLEKLLEFWSEVEALRSTRSPTTSTAGPFTHPFKTL